jgi:hypothetical protein
MKNYPHITSSSNAAKMQRLSALTINAILALLSSESISLPPGCERTDIQGGANGVHWA